MVHRMIDIREAGAQDWPALWAVLKPVFRAGNTYAYTRDIDSAAARAAWLELPEATFVAVDRRAGILGTYFIKPNHPGQGGHVCNCGYAVAVEARRQGIAGQLCRHSQQQARSMGFRAMQYNLVAATNTGAIALWQRQGFEVVGRLPGAFAHPEAGDVDALVMYKRLDQPV